MVYFHLLSFDHLIKDGTKILQLRAGKPDESGHKMDKGDVHEEGRGRWSVMNYKKDESTSPDPTSRHGGSIKASEFSNGLLAMRELMARGVAGTWDYVTKSVFDADNPEHRRKFYDTHGIDGKLVGIIGRTHHTKPFDESSKEAFKKTIDEGYTPAIGTWTDSERPDSKPYNDVSMIISDDEENLLKLKKKHNQITILVIDKDANKRYI